MLKKLLIMVSLCSLQIANASEATKAFACYNCGYEQAKQIAMQEAPVVGSCSTGDMPGSFPSAPSVCDGVEQDIIITSVNDRSVFKFHLVVIPGFGGASISIFDQNPTSADLQISTKFFIFIDDISTAIDQVHTEYFSQTESMTSPTASSLGLSVQATSSDAEDFCNANHPTSYFKSAESRRDILRGIADDIREGMGSRSWTEFTHDGYQNSAQIDIAVGAIGYGFGMEYFQKALRVTKTYGAGNNLTFDLSVSGQLDDVNDKLEFGFKLHPEISKIDGLQVNQLFSEGEVVQLWDTTMSDCWNEFVEEEGQRVDPHPDDPSTGTGTYRDPYRGPASTTKTTGWCVYTYKVCTSTSITDLETAPSSCTVPVYFTAVDLCGL